MSAFIDFDGTLLEIGCPTTLTRDTEQLADFTTTLGGVRKAFIRKGGRRAWSIDVNVASPGEVSTIEAIARAMGPVRWYGAEAAAGSLLSPQASGFDTIPYRATDAGMVQLPDRTVAHAIGRALAGAIYVGGPESGAGVEMVSIRPGTQVSVAAWATESFQPSALWRDASGENQSTTVGTLTTGGSEFTWRKRTFTAPDFATQVGFFFSTSTLVARPSIAWGPDGHDELGTGCPQAIIHSPSHTTESVWLGGNWTDSSYRVTEVG